MGGRVFWGGQGGCERERGGGRVGGQGGCERRFEVFVKIQIKLSGGGWSVGRRIWGDWVGSGWM